MSPYITLEKKNLQTLSVFETVHFETVTLSPYGYISLTLNNSFTGRKKLSTTLSLLVRFIKLIFILEN